MRIPKVGSIWKKFDGGRKYKILFMAFDYSSLDKFVVYETTPTGNLKGTPVRFVATHKDFTDNFYEDKR